jgi:hypothetical protein
MNYHTTSRRLLPHIMREGLNPGSDEMPPKNVVWLDADVTLIGSKQSPIAARCHARSALPAECRDVGSVTEIAVGKSAKPQLGQ